MDAATYLFGAVERCIEAQLLADAAAAAGRGAETIEIGYEEALQTRRLYTDEMEFCIFASAFEEMVRASRGELQMVSGWERNGYVKFPREW